MQNSYVAMKPAVQRCSMFLIETDDKGNQGLYRMTNYGDTGTVFEESRNNTKYKVISPDAKTVTLELYVSKEEKNRTTYKKMKQEQKILTEKAKDVFMKVMKILWIYIARWKEK